MSSTSGDDHIGSSGASAAGTSASKLPVTCLVIGMAGSGKTTFVQRIVAHLIQKRRSSYVMNLDPAVANVPYKANIDIRDTVNYKSVMEQYKLGPNGAIVTSLNLFATRFDQVVGYVEKSAEKLDYCIVDTPGQIEVFTWSASGQIITESLASAVPTVIVYVIDTPRSQNPVTFMSNMTYACSIMYKTRLPFLIVFNKTDILSHRFAEHWMQDVEAFEEAIQSEKTFMSTLTRSLAFVMDEFYNNIRTVGVSAATGIGIDDFFVALDECAEEYRREYLPFLEERQRERNEQVEKLKEDQINQTRRQMEAQETVLDGKTAAAAVPADEEENMQPQDNGSASDSDLEPFDNFDYEQDRRDYEEYMALLQGRQAKQQQEDPS